MPARNEDIQDAIDEGVEIQELYSPIKIEKENGNVKGILLQHMKLGEKDLSKEAYLGERDVFLEGQWHTTPIIDMDRIRPGNEINGIAIIEAPSTTLVLPPGKRVTMDEWSLLWLD